MTRHRFHRIVLPIAGLVVIVSVSPGAESQTTGTTSFDEAIASGTNYDKAEFRLWYPADVGALQAVLVLVPGSNADGRLMVEDSVWQAFASRHKLALVGCRFTDKPHEQSFIEQY